MSSANEVNANLDINTTQPRPLRGLKLRGVKPRVTIQTELTLEDGSTKIITIAEEDYDRDVHGVKVDKLSSRKKVAKKASKKKKASSE